VETSPAVQTAARIAAAYFDAGTRCLVEETGGLGGKGTKILLKKEKHRRVTIPAPPLNKTGKRDTKIRGK